MKKRAYRLLMFLAPLWVIYANSHMLDRAYGAIAKANRDLDIKAEMRTIATLVKVEYIDSSQFPANLVELYRSALRHEERQVSANTGKDLWGTWYALVPSKKQPGFYIASAGPDRRWRTKDDIFFFQSLADVSSATGAMPQPRRR